MMFRFIRRWWRRRRRNYRCDCCGRWVRRAERPASVRVVPIEQKGPETDQLRKRLGPFPGGWAVRLDCPECAEKREMLESTPRTAVGSFDTYDDPIEAEIPEDVGAVNPEYMKDEKKLLTEKALRFCREFGASSKKTTAMAETFRKNYGAAQSR